MNPGKVVAEPDPGVDLRIGPDYHAEEPSTTAFDFSAQGGFARAVELCSGVGACRKTASRDDVPQLHGHARRGAHHPGPGQPAPRGVCPARLSLDGLADRTLHEALDLCLQCKACKTECPSNVDMAKLKVEALYQKSKSRTLPLGHYLMGNLHRFNPIGSAVAPLANWSLRDSGLSSC